MPYVPVLVDGDEVVNDSHRIRQYLDWQLRRGGGDLSRFAAAS